MATTEQEAPGRATLAWALTHKGLVRGLARLAAAEIVVDADAAQIPVGVNGEALVLDTPVRCRVQPLALRVRVPRDRPGVPDAKPQIDWNRLRQLALTVPGTGEATPDHG